MEYIMLQSLFMICMKDSMQVLKLAQLLWIFIGAYNKVPLYFLLYQLLKLSIHTVLINWISAAVHQRKVMLRCDSCASELITVTPSLPQGASLSPVLFVCTQFG